MTGPVKWLLAILPIAAALVGIVAGFSLLPARSVAVETGRVVPWFMTWEIIWLTTAPAFVVSGVLVVESDRRS